MKPSIRTPCLALIAALAVAPLAAQGREVVRVPDSIPGLPFSPAIRAGGFIFVSGMIGNVLGTRQLADTGITGQTRQTLANIAGVLTRAGSSLAQVVRCTVYLPDLKDYAAMNAEYARHFPADPPARATVGVKELVFGARVEIECTALAGT